MLYPPLLAQSSAVPRGLLLRPVVPKRSNIASLLRISGVNGSAAAPAAHTPAASGYVFVPLIHNSRISAKWARQQRQIANAFKILCFHFYTLLCVVFLPSLVGLAGFTFCARGAGSERGEPGRNDRRRVQSVLWGGAPAPAGLMPAPRRAGGHCLRWVRVVSSCRACDRVCYP